MEKVLIVLLAAGAAFGAGVLLIGGRGAGRGLVRELLHPPSGRRNP